MCEDQPTQKGVISSEKTGKLGRVIIKDLVQHTKVNHRCGVMSSLRRLERQCSMKSRQVGSDPRAIDFQKFWF